MSTAKYGSLSGPRFLMPVKHVPYYCSVHAPRDAGEIAADTFLDVLLVNDIVNDCC